MRATAVLCVVLMMVAAPCRAQPLTYTTIDYLGGGHGSTFISGINNSGIVIGTFQPAGGGSAVISFMSTPPYKSFTTISVPGALSTTVTGIDDVGQVTGLYQVLGIPINPILGFLREPAQRHEQYFSILPRMGYLSAAVGLMDYTHLFGQTTPGGGFELNLQTGVTTTFTVPLGPNSSTTVATVNAINHAGLTVGSLQDTVVPSDGSGVVWQMGSNTVVPVTMQSARGPVHTELSGVNNRGQAVGTYQNDGIQPDNLPHGFVFDVTSRTSKPVTVGDYTHLTAVNDADQVAGWYADTSSIHGLVISGVKPNFTK